VTTESATAPPRSANAGRTAAWLAKQVELGLAAADLSLSQYRILGLLAEGSAMSSALAERLAVRPPSVTAVIDGLEARGLVERRHSENDRRRVSLEITQAGRRTLETADDSVNGRLSQLAEALGPGGAAKALANLELWARALRAHRAARESRS
jgi:long-chain acyl-CoA synthetase